MIAQQKSFSSGLDLLSADTQVADDGYIWLINARNRFGVIQPVPKHIELDAPAGLKQGCIGLGNVLILFVAGRAYYQVDGATTWIQVGTFQMSATAPIIWTEAVPASTFSFVRKLNSTGNIYDPIQASVDFKISGTPSCIVCQDGSSQPWLIIYDSANNLFVSRPAKTYDEWENISDTTADREYVPIGRQMMYKDGILYVVAPDGKSVYRSITGRPLDFMINVTTDGNKLPSELEGGVTSMSFAFDYDEITCLKAIDIEGCFVYATARNTRIISVDYTVPIFGEPQFRRQALLNVGIVNQFSFGDALNDFVCIEQSGVKSFNAVQQLKFKGNNSIFSLQLASLLYNHNTRKPIKQRFCSLFNYDNYLLFNLDTFWGNLIAVYDIVKGVWAALDITDVARIRQFTTTETSSQIKLYCITETNKVFQMYADSATAFAQLRVKSWTPQGTDVEHKSQWLRCMFDGGTYDGKVELIEFVDDQLSTNTRSEKELKVQLGGVNYPVQAPVIASTEQRTENISFSITNGLTGKRISFVLQWDNDARLIEYQLTTSDQQNMNSLREQNLTQISTYGTPSNS